MTSRGLRYVTRARNSPSPAKVVVVIGGACWNAGGLPFVLNSKLFFSPGASVGKSFSVGAAIIKSVRSVCRSTFPSNVHVK